MSYDLQQTGNYMEKLDLALIQGIYVTEDPRGRAGVRMWCGYCITLLHMDQEHLGDAPFLSLMAKMADAHRATECPNPNGPFRVDWAPRASREWDEMVRRRIAREQAEAEMIAGMREVTQV